MNKYFVGQRVIMVPNHAAGDITHPLCERGVVSSVKDVPNIGQRVWVRYSTGDTGALTPVLNLVSEDPSLLSVEIGSEFQVMNLTFKKQRNLPDGSVLASSKTETETVIKETFYVFPPDLIVSVQT